MTLEDVVAADHVAAAALPPSGGDPDRRRRWMHARIGRLVTTDPEGCWVATDDDGALTGVALALVRDGIWGLSLLAVAPDRQERGTGRALLDATLQHDAGVRGWLIASSVDPKAMRLYARAGFRIHPCVAAGGPLNRSRLPAGLRSREAGTERLEQAGALAREVRGGAYDPGDLQLYLDGGGQLLVCGDDGFAIARQGSTSMLVARDGATAADLLWSVLATAERGASVLADFISAGQDWAIRTALDARLDLSPDGPYFSRGQVGPLRPFLPSGAFL